jgi:hypothetical protein
MAWFQGGDRTGITNLTIYLIFFTREGDKAEFRLK